MLRKSRSKYFTAWYESELGREITLQCGQEVAYELRRDVEFEIETLLPDPKVDYSKAPTLPYLGKVDLKRYQPGQGGGAYVSRYRHENQTSGVRIFDKTERDKALAFGYCLRARSPFLFDDGTPKSMAALVRAMGDISRRKDFVCWCETTEGEKFYTQNATSLRDIYEVGVLQAFFGRALVVEQPKRWYITDTNPLGIKLFTNAFDAPVSQQRENELFQKSRDFYCWADSSMGAAYRAELFDGLVVRIGMEAANAAFGGWGANPGMPVKEGIVAAAKGDAPGLVLHFADKPRSGELNPDIAEITVGGGFSDEESLLLVETVMSRKAFFYWLYTPESEAYFLSRKAVMDPAMFRRIMARMYASTGA